SPSDAVPGGRSGRRRPDRGGDPVVAGPDGSRRRRDGGQAATRALPRAAVLRPAGAEGPRPGGPADHLRAGLPGGGEPHPAEAAGGRGEASPGGPRVRSGPGRAGAVRQGRAAAAGPRVRLRGAGAGERADRPAAVRPETDEPRPRGRGRGSGCAGFGPRAGSGLFVLLLFLLVRLHPLGFPVHLVFLVHDGRRDRSLDRVLGDLAAVLGGELVVLELAGDAERDLALLVLAVLDLRLRLLAAAEAGAGHGPGHLPVLDFQLQGVLDLLGLVTLAELGRELPGAGRIGV